MLMVYYWFVLMALLTGANILHWCFLLFRPSAFRIQKLVELSSRQIFPDPCPERETHEKMALDMDESDSGGEEEMPMPPDSPAPPSICSCSAISPAFPGHNSVCMAISNATTTSVLSDATTIIGQSMAPQHIASQFVTSSESG